MLAKLLSGKSFFIQIILGILFLLLFFGQLHTGNIPYGTIWGLIAFIVTVVLCYLFFATSKLFKAPGLPFWFFIIWAFVFSGISAETRISISFLVCTVLFWRMVHAEEKSDSRNYAFDVGIGLSISSFFYPPSIFIAGLILFNYLYMQSLNLRTILLFALGFIFPMAAGIQILYLLGKMNWLNNLNELFYIDFWNLTSGLIPLIMIGIFILIAWFDHISYSSKQDINKRHIYFLFFLYFLNWIIILIFFAGENMNFLAVLGFPVSTFLARLVQYQKSPVRKEVFLWIYLAIMAGFYFREEIVMIYNDLLGNVAF